MLWLDVNLCFRGSFLQWELAETGGKFLAMLKVSNFKSWDLVVSAFKR